MKIQSISICYITKNESQDLERSLSSLCKLLPHNLHEIVVVDTGSNDDTIKMCQNYTSSIYSFTWCDDFSKARNHAALRANNNWILYLDSDEYITAWDEDAIQKLLASPYHLLGSILLKNICGVGTEQYESIDILYRLYNKEVHTFQCPIHEQLVCIHDKDTFKYVDFPIKATHTGYQKSTEQLRGKAERNIKLLKQELLKSPNNAYLLYQIGKGYNMINDFASAKHYYDLGLSCDVNPLHDYVKSMVVAYGNCMLSLKQFDEALCLEVVYETFDTYADYVFLIGMIYMNNARFEDAIAQFIKATTLNDCDVVGANSFRAYYNIGVIYECTNQIPTALLYYKKASDFTPAKERIKFLSAK